MFDNFLPIPDAEFLPFYPLVLKLAVCVRAHGPVGGGARANTGSADLLRIHGWSDGTLHTGAGGQGEGAY